MKKFSDLAWEHITDVYNAIVGHPFNKEIMDGSLSNDRFSYYIQQDLMYLEGYARANAMIASKIPSKYFIEFLQHAKNAYSTERELVHDFFSGESGICEVVGISPATMAYTTYLLANASLAPIEVALAALLPCFWIYREVGNYIASGFKEDNPYNDWIAAYSSKEFNQSVDNMIDIVDTLAENTTLANELLMLEAFYHSSIYEWYFWDDAYNMRVFDDFVV